MRRLAAEKEALERTTAKGSVVETELRAKLAALEAASARFNESKFKDLESKLAQSECDRKELEQNNRMLQDTVDAHNNKSAACGVM